MKRQLPGDPPATEWRKMIAQGEGLGSKFITTKAPEGRKIGESLSAAPAWARESCPRIPRLTPWANIYRRSAAGCAA